MTAVISKHSFTFNGTRCEATTRYSERDGRGRVYVWSDPASTKAMEKAIHVAAQAKGLLHGWTKRGEHKDIDAQWDKMNRAIVAHKRAVAVEAFASMSDEGADREAIARELSFSRKAGCACGCSPGFITTLFRNKEVFISEAKDTIAPKPLSTTRKAKHVQPSFAVGRVQPIGTWGSTFIREGTYGPAHDPYSFSEIAVKTADGLAVVLHGGLSTWLSIGDADEPRSTAEKVHVDTWQRGEELLRKLTGVRTIDVARYEARLYCDTSEDPMGPASRYE